MTLGEKIQHLRKSKGMSQEQLADKITISRQAISKWELGESMPDVDNILQLSKVFGVSADYLLNDDFNSDMDIPAVKTNHDNLKTAYRSKIRKASYWLISVSLFSVMIMWILSSVIPAMKTYPDLTGAPAPVQEGTELSDEEKQHLIDMESMTFYTTREVRGDLGAFLDTYHLTALFALCCVVMFAGVILLMYTFNVFKKRKTKL